MLTPNARPIAAFAAVVVFCFAASAPAAVLVQYNFENPAGTSTFTTAATTLNIDSASAFDVIDGDDNDPEQSTFASHTPQRSIFEFTGATSITVNTAPYWFFTITEADPLDLDSLSFAIGKAGSSAGTARYNVSSSVDGHATLLSATDFTYSGIPENMSAPANQVVDLSGAAFQNLDASGGITFRIYYAESSTASSTGARIDTVILSGDFASAEIPAPAALPAGLAMLALAAARRC